MPTKGLPIKGIAATESDSKSPKSPKSATIVCYVVRNAHELSIPSLQTHSGAIEEKNSSKSAIDVHPKLGVLVTAGNRVVMPLLVTKIVAVVVDDSLQLHVWPHYTQGGAMTVPNTFDRNLVTS